MVSGKAFFFVSETVGCIWYVHRYSSKSYCDYSGRPMPYVSLIQKDADTLQQLDEKFIPDTIARTSQLPTKVVNSVNGQTGDVVITEGVNSWNDLQDKPFGNKLIAKYTPKDGGVVYDDGTWPIPENDCIVRLNGVEYVGKIIEISDHEWSIDAFDNNNNFITSVAHLTWNGGLFDFTPKGNDSDIIELYDPTRQKKLSSKYIDKMSWENIINTPFVGEYQCIYGDDQSSSNSQMLIPIDELKIGNLYLVRIDDIEYVCTAQNSIREGYDIELKTTYCTVYYSTTREALYASYTDNAYHKLEIVDMSLLLPDQYIPNTIARTTDIVLEDVTEAPTAEQYNALLAILRQAGILAT